jgi:ABC-type polysaccharide/polyol phosphate transport system ATPase subunit
MGVRRAAMSVMISLQHLTKSFRLSHTSSLKTAILRKSKRSIEQFSVLNDLSLEIEKGECVALIGRNGAGKSTLLSIISRIYKPTSGQAIVNGRIAPLLELGAGFHPELTGLENIIFNGVILGLTRKQVEAKLDEIIAFSELEHHIDSPIRTYSSGMLARLGFSIATHVDADILIVDEVLAVGDFAFEQKCYSRIEEFKKSGGTILFVSHQMDSIRKVADRCVWLEDGKVRMDGDPEVVITAYHSGA